MKISDRDHPFYRPLWRRIAIVAFIAAWSVYELFVVQDELWTFLSLAFLGYAVWTFLITWKHETDAGSKEPLE